MYGEEGFASFVHIAQILAMALTPCLGSSMSRIPKGRKDPSSSAFGRGVVPISLDQLGELVCENS